MTSVCYISSSLQYYTATLTHVRLIIDAFTSSTLNEGALTPILVDIDTILTTAVTQLLLLVDETLDVILTSVDGTVVLEVSEVAVLVANFITVSFIPLYQTFHIDKLLRLSVRRRRSLHCR